MSHKRYLECAKHKPHSHGTTPRGHTLSSPRAGQLCGSQGVAAPKLYSAIFHSWCVSRSWV